MRSLWLQEALAGLPFFGALGEREDILDGYGFSGNGVGPSLVAGRILASRALGVDDEWLAAGLPAEPVGGFPRNRAGRFRPSHSSSSAGLAVRAAVARKERAEDAGRRPDPRTARLAALAPAGLVPLKRG